MDKKDIIKKISEKKLNEIIKIDELMSKHTTFRTGGPVDIFITPRNAEELIEVIKTCSENDANYIIIGNGSNILVKDGGIRGIVIKVGKNMSNIEVRGTSLFVEPGAILSKISNIALEHSLKGFEFAEGIPGMLGGAITMNAGAYGGEIKNVIKKVKALNTKGDIVELNNKEMNFGYRKSAVQEEGLVILEAEIELEHGEYEKIKNNIRDISKRRIEKQPLNLPSGGSTFKRPEGYYASKLIEDAGLKGLRFNGAQVSEKHSGFIVNTGNAKTSDIINLIKEVQDSVYEKFNVKLELELKVMGENSN